MGNQGARNTDSNKAGVDQPLDRKSTRQQLLALLPMRERTLCRNGALTAVLEGGDGPPIVLLHGPGGYAANWQRVIPHLVTTNHIVAPDLPGHGSSGMFGGPADVARLLGWLDDLIECTCPVPPVLVGETLGGAIAARFAIEHGERIAELVLVDALGLTSFNPMPEFGRALQAFIAAPADDTHDDLWSLCAFDLMSLRRQLGQRWELIKAYNLELARTPATRKAMDQLMGQFGIPAIPSADLARIAVPTALIWGRQDRATPVRVAEEAAARFGWPLIVIDNAGDAPDFEQPGSFVKALRSVLGAPKIQEAAL